MLGLYLHLPFCESICNYCNFNRGLLDEPLKQRYVEALEAEIRRAGDASAVDSLYFGGGTPSLLNADEVARLVRACRQSFAVTSDAEVTDAVWRYENPYAECLSLKDYAAFYTNKVTLEVDGEVISQSNTINRYDGKLAGLYPEDPLQAALCDEVMDAVEDVLTQIVATFAIDDDAEKRAAREALAAEPLPLYLRRLQEMLDARGGEYFADNRLTVADLKVSVWISQLRSGMLDYIPTDLVERVAPNLVEHDDRIHAHPGVAAWYAQH